MVIDFGYMGPIYLKVKLYFSAPNIHLAFRKEK